MKTETAYYTIPAGETVSAEILEIIPSGELWGVILDTTPFYPEGGGQPGDRGTVNGFQVLDVREEAGEILHLVSQEDGLKLSPGPAELRADPGRRRDLTVHHTAQHLLSATILKQTGAATVSMHLGDAVCTIDVEKDEFTPEELVRAEEAVQDAIESDTPVVLHLCPPEDIHSFPLRKVPPRGEAVIRVVEISGYDFSPCCGTHLGSTGQIGILRILGAEKYKGKSRISFIAGRRVLRDSRLLRENADAISRVLKIPPDQTAGGVLALLERANQMEKKLQVNEDECARFAAEEMIREAGLAAGSGPAVVVRQFPDKDMDTVLRIARAAQKMSPAVFALASLRDGKFAVLTSDKGIDLRPFLKDALAESGGSGGGGASFFQGSLPSGDSLAAFLDRMPALLAPARGN
ncbi:alanyl-tRNA editing protein [Breznakiella homolactica]|uniref:Alanine--tRNA ligase n=1 Tax=Breznakiella homolactica TaxID=2798577 RepID=A0A7T7XNU4_9SPIR|nr:alanyl-tRNA editing protein [Breznakiella homolactica]QQO09761.1 alanyl-tRNA editing protein [Breznakiella homolactica]